MSDPTRPDVAHIGLFLERRVQESIEQQTALLATLTPADVERAHHEAVLENERRNTDRLRDLNIPPVFKDDIRLVSDVRKWIKDFKAGGDAFYATSGHSLMLHGIPGCGKTHTAWQIVKLLLRSYSMSVRFVEVKKLLAELTQRGANDIEILKELQERSRDLLVLDDLGAEKLTDSKREKLEDLLDHRWKYRLPIVATTNFDGSEFVERFGGRAASRLAGMCRQVFLPEIDYRRKQRDEGVPGAQEQLGGLA